MGRGRKAKPRAIRALQGNPGKRALPKKARPLGAVEEKLREQWWLICDQVDKAEEDLKSKDLETVRQAKIWLKKLWPEQRYFAEALRRIESQERGGDDDEFSKFDARA